MKMKIPIWTEYRENKTARFQAETNLIHERTVALKTMRESSAKTLDAIMKTAAAPVMSLNDELYGDTSPYSSQIWENNTTFARRQSRIAYWDSPPAQAMIGRFVDLVHGPRLELQAAPIFDIIPGAPQERETQQELIKNIEQRYRLWAKSKKSDETGKMNHHQRSRENFKNLLIDGEYFCILRYSQSRKRNPLTIQYIKPENMMRSGSQVASGNTESNGIEYNSKGQEVAYHVYSSSTGKSVRIQKTGTRSGRTFVIHVELDGGVGILAGIIQELTKLADFQALEIQAAVINALFAVWVETEIGGTNKDLVNKQGISGITTDFDTGERVNISEFEAKMNTTQFQRGGVIAQGMGEGQKLHSFDTKRPTANFEAFYKATLRNLFSAKGMPYDVAMYDPEASYSAIRANLLLFWNKVMTLRSDHITDYEDVIYTMWLWGEIDNRNIVAPGYEDERYQDAWSNANFIGPARPDIDPKRSFDAHKGEVDEGFKTNQQVASERGGGDFSENIKRLTGENKAKAEANTPIVTLNNTTYANSKSETVSTSKVEEEQ